MEKYDTRSKSLRDHSGNRQELNYGQGYVSGTIGKDRLCFDVDNKCLQDIELLVIRLFVVESKYDIFHIELLVGDQGKDLEKDKFSGIVGLAP